MIKERDGSSSVLLLMITATMILLILTFITAAEMIAARGISDSLVTTASRSVLSEYDKALYREYGIFALRAFEPEIEEKLRFYISSTISRMPYFTLSDIVADTSAYNLINTENFKRAVIDRSKYEIAKGLAKKLKEDLNVGMSEIASGEKRPAEELNRTHNLLAGSIIKELPSETISSKKSISEIIKSTALTGVDIFREGTDKYLLNSYIMNHFNNALSKVTETETFFDSEAEYIVEGGRSDNENKSKIKRDIILLRNILNIAFIRSHPEMVAELSAAAAALTPGPQAALTEAALAEMWAYAEAKNDAEILFGGGKVRLIKTKDDWALSLDMATKELKNGYIDTHSSKGSNYQGYLQLLLFIENDDIKLLRIMDLIQINMKGNSDRSFLIKECCSGFRTVVRINGKDRSYAHQY